MDIHILLIFVKKYGKFVLLGFFLCIFVLVVRQLLHSSLATFDETVYGFVSGFRSSTLTFIFRTISFFSGPYFLFILSLCLFFVFKSTKYSLLSLLNLIVIVLFNQGLKLLFSRPRPFEWMLVGETGYSFPSGHAMVSVAFYGMIIYLIWRTNLDKKYKKLWTIILVVLVLLIGLSRIYLGVHYASDIVAGFTISLSYLIIATSLIDYYLKIKSNRKKS
mgnify:CR=1 FL=1